MCLLKKCSLWRYIVYHELNHNEINDFSINNAAKNIFFIPQNSDQHPTRHCYLIHPDIKHVNSRVICNYSFSESLRVLKSMQDRLENRFRPDLWCTTNLHLRGPFELVRYFVFSSIFAFDVFFLLSFDNLGLFFLG